MYRAQVYTKNRLSHQLSGVIRPSYRIFSRQIIRAEDEVGTEVGGEMSRF